MTEQRYRAVLAVIADGRTVGEVASEWGVCRQTMHRWLGRYESDGLEGLGDRSCRPVRLQQPCSTCRLRGQRYGKFDFNYTLGFPEPPGPGTQEHDANPTGVLATDEGAYVADSGSNTLDRIGEDGQIQILVHDGFRFSKPNFPSDSVPTCVVRTEDGLLVGELSGRLLKVHGTTFTVINNPLLTHITGCTSDGNGNVYFVNMFGSGAPFTPPPASNFFIGNVVQYDTETGNASMLVNGLMLPNMDTVGPDGNLYVTVGSICPTAAFVCHGATGGVIKITLPHGEND